MAESDLSLNEVPFAATPDGWIDGVLTQFNLFLSDHASCEKKASGMAMNVAAHYPDQPRLLEAMVDLAVEELNHYREVMRLLIKRGVVPGPDEKDLYVNELNRCVRRGTENFLLDRLLVGAVVERRGAERFGLIANALTDPELKKFYQAITASEARHWTLFVELAKSHCEGMDVHGRLHELSLIEGEIMLAQPFRPALH
ncbi:MAG: tRNA-(ms[2]io[6]A)-hydroxylase [Pseudomonadota bacterium]